MSLLSYWWGILLLAAVVLLVGAFWLLPKTEANLPFRVVPPDEVRLLARTPEQNPVNMQALVQGRLLIVDGCVKIAESEQEARTAIWRSGFKVGEDSKGVFVYHSARQVRHRVGEEVNFAGGYVEALEPEWIAKRLDDQNLMGCQGPFVFVDSTGS